MSYIRDDAAAVALLVGVYVQAAHDALRGSVSAREWLTLNDIPPSSWPMVAAVKVTPKLAPRKPRRGRRVA